MSRCSPGSTHGRICPRCKPSSRFVHTRSHRSVERPLIPPACYRSDLPRRNPPSRQISRPKPSTSWNSRSSSTTNSGRQPRTCSSILGWRTRRPRSVSRPTHSRYPAPYSPALSVRPQHYCQYSILSRMGYFISTSSISSQVVTDPVCVYLFLSCHNCHEEPALCNTVDPWNTIPLVVFSSPSSSLFVLVPFPLPTWLRAWPPVGSGVLLIPYELHLGRRRDRLRMMLEVRFGPEMV